MAKCPKIVAKLDGIYYTLQVMKTLIRYGGSMDYGKRWLRYVVGFFSLGIIFLIVPLEKSSAQCSLDMQVSTIPVQQLSPADIDFEHFDSRSLLFTITITNSNPDTVNADLEGFVDIYLADGTNFSDPHAARFTTNQFSVPLGVRTITNLNIGRNGDIGTQKFDFDDAAKNRLQDVSLSTGKFPAGRYVFHLELHSSCTQTIPTKDVVFQLQNASRVELRSPQDGTTTNEFPFFEFFQEGSSAVLTVAEKTDNQSREDAISRKPPMLEVELSGQNSFLYSGGRPLEEGKTYVWDIVSNSAGAGGTAVEVSSPIWSFTVSNSASNSIGSLLMDQLLTTFPKYKDLLEQIRKDAFVQAGQCTLNGSTITEPELMNLLSQLRDNDSVIITSE